MNPTHTESWSPPANTPLLDRIADGYRTACLVRAAFSCQLFDWLQQNGAATRADIGNALALRGAHLVFFLQALESLGCLQRDGDMYRLAAGMDELLTSQSPWSYGPRIETLMSPHGRWSNLANFLTEGKSHSALPDEALFPHGGVRYHPMFDEAGHLLEAFSSVSQLDKAGSLLCFDGCDALFSAFFSRRYPHIPISVVVVEERLAVSRRYLQELAAGASWTLRVGNPLECAPTRQFDRVALIHNLYPLRKNTASALASAAEQLAPGGELLAAHWFCQEACEAAPGVLSSLKQATITDSHPLCHAASFCERMALAGLEACTKLDSCGPYGVTKLYFGRKP